MSKFDLTTAVAVTRKQRDELSGLIDEAEIMQRRLRREFASVDALNQNLITLQVDQNKPLTETNAERVERMIDGEYTEGTEGNIPLVLADLRLLCKREGWDFAKLDQEAVQIYLKEANETLCRYCKQLIYSAGGPQNAGDFGWLHTETGNSRCSQPPPTCAEPETES